MDDRNIDCRMCRRRFEEGADVLEVQEGVIGKLGFVDLGEKLLFCNFDCLRGYLNGSKGRVLKRRVP